MPIRLAKPADADAMQAVVQAAYAPYVARLGKPPGPMLDDYAQRIAAVQAWVLEDGGALAAILVLEEADGALLLDNLAVRPDMQGRGHGRTLVAFAEAEARRRGFGAVRLYTHVLMTENVALYRRLGFQETGRASEKGYDRVYTAKALAKAAG